MIWVAWFGAAIAPDASTAFQMPRVGEVSPVDSEPLMAARGQIRPRARCALMFAQRRGGSPTRPAHRQVLDVELPPPAAMSFAGAVPVKAPRVAGHFSVGPQPAVAAHDRCSRVRLKGGF